jgi:hypothetical protein
MACCINVSHTSIPPADAGGVWYYTSGPTPTVTVTAGTGCSGTSQEVDDNNDEVINLSGGSFSFDADGKDVGNYVFTYILAEGQACEVSQTYTIAVIAPPEAGENDSGGTHCETSTDTLDIWACIGCDTLTCVTTGTWSGTTPGGGTWNNTTPGFTWTPATPAATFNLTGRAAGTYTFTYTASASGTNPNCTNCTDTATCTVVITEAPNAGSPASTTVCN